MRRLATRATLGIVGVVAAATLATAAPIHSAAGGSLADCSKATAHRLVDDNRLNGFDLADPVVQVLCGPFTGPGSEAMAVTIAAPTCWSPQRWAVFSFTAGAWKLVLDEPAFLAGPLVAAGSDIRETTAVWRLGDPRCLPDGGTHARTWHWDGSKLMAGAWTQVEAGKPLTSSYFDSPAAVGVTCYMAAQVICQSVKTRPRLYQQKALLRGNGAVSICRVSGTSNRCRLGCSCDEGETPVLAYGQEVVVGRFTCRSLRTGIQCTVTKTGKGFVINRDRAARVG